MPNLAYLINSYPMPSLTFIRREIASIEAQGVPVVRYAIRDSGLPRVDPDDQAEASRTQWLLKAGAHRLLYAVITTMLSRPSAFLRCLSMTCRMARRSGRGSAVHFAYLAEACLLRRWTARDDVGHVHVHFGTNSATVAMLCRLLGGPEYSMTIHGPAEFDAPEGLALGEKVRHSRFTVAISSFGRSQVWRWSHPSDWEKVHVVRCGLDVDFLEGDPGDPPEAPRLLNIGRLSPEKGQLVLVEAASELVRRGRSFELTIIGDGDFRASLETLIERRGLRDVVRLVGWQSSEEVRRCLKASRALVQSSFAEGLPVVIMEAFACQRPVVSTAIAGIPELVRAGESGWLVAAGSASQLADAIEEVLDAEVGHLRGMGTAGAARVAAQHDVRCESSRLLSLFPASVASSRRPGSGAPAG